MLPLTVTMVKADLIPNIVEAVIPNSSRAVYPVESILTAKLLDVPTIIILLAVIPLIKVIKELLSNVGSEI